MKTDDIVHRIAARLGGASARESAALLEATLEELGATLPTADRKLLCGGLPEPLAEVVRRRERQPARGLEGLPEALAARAGIPVARAEEALEVVGEALGKQIGVERAEVLARRLGKPLADWLAPPDHGELGPAEGPKWSRAPRARPRHVAEAEPSPRGLASGRPDRAQADSVPRAPDPHEDEKLSSGATTQVREREDLATGRPGSRRPISRDGS